jgi:hypothetical protein
MVARVTPANFKSKRFIKWSKKSLLSLINILARLGGYLIPTDGVSIRAGVL